MNIIKIQKNIIKIIEKKRKIQLNSFNEKLNFKFLDKGHIDSINIINFILDIEENFKVKLTALDTQSNNFRTPLGISKILKKKINDKKNKK